MEFLPWRFPVTLVAHDDRVAGIETLIKHMAVSEFRCKTAECLAHGWNLLNGG